MLVANVSIGAGALAAEAYATSFALTENPIVEDGYWRNGNVVSAAWQNFRSSPGKAWGLQSGTKPPYDDAVAFRAARPGKIWMPNQDVRGRVFLTDRTGWGSGGSTYHEVELHLRGSISAGVCRTYEVVFSMNAGITYCEITQWLGPFGDDAGDIATCFAFLKSNTGFFAPNHGDWVRATISGTIIRAYTSTNGTTWTECITAHDISGDASPILTGMPGMGHWKNDTAAVGDKYGFSEWSAQEAA